MREYFHFLRNHFVIFSFVLFFAASILFLGHTEKVFSLSLNQLMSNRSEAVEYLKLKVPKSYRNEWIGAEKESWEPWLKGKEGFIGRQLFWDKNKEEAILLISWSSRAQWKSIPESEIELVQKRFEEIARLKTGQKSGNPFPLIFEGELIPQ